MDKEVLRTADRANITLKFIGHPEYMKEGTRVIFREGRTKAIGVVRAIHPTDTNKPKQAKTNRAKQGQAFMPVKNNKQNKQKGNYKH